MARRWRRAAGGRTVHRVIVRGPDGGALAQLVERRFLSRRILFLLRGPLPLQEQPCEPLVLAALAARFGRSTLVWTPERAAGCARRPVMTGYNTAWIDLMQDSHTLRARLDGKWRNALHQAEGNGLKVVPADRPALAWLLCQNEGQRRRVGYQGPRPAFLDALARAAAEGGELVARVALYAGEPVAGIMLVQHGAAATYEVGFTSERGRVLRATHLLLWQAALELKALGARWLDLGGLNTDKAPGIARFKLGLGPLVSTLPGTFILHLPGPESTAVGGCR